MKGSKKHLKAWWQPIVEMKFDDPEQEAPFWTGSSNNVALNTPFPGIQIKALAIVGPQVGVFVSGTRRANLMLIQKYLKRERKPLLSALPAGTEITDDGSWPIKIYEFNVKSDNKRRAWIMRTLNEFGNVLRPRLRRWYEESRRAP